MKKNQTYRLRDYGTKSVRRDYSTASGALDLPNLVEMQTESFDRFLKEGISEVFEEVYPIDNYYGNMQLNFVGFDFDEPEMSAEDCRIFEQTYTAPLRTTMELEIEDGNTGEIIKKREEVFFGDVPLMTEEGTFIINGAERVIVSQIVRSPGSYFDIGTDERNGDDVFNGEVIPSRGTWLSIESDSRKTPDGRLLDMRIDRRRKILSTILMKAVGMSLNVESSESGFDVKGLQTFLTAIGKEVYTEYTDEISETEFLSMYNILFTSMFGNYADLIVTLDADKISTENEALLTIYENQRIDEVPTLEGSISLMNSKFFDPRRYDLTGAGRYKLNKKLGVLDRLRGNVAAQDIKDGAGKVIVKEGTLIGRDEAHKLRNELSKGTYMTPLPFNDLFTEPDVVSVNLSDAFALENRILAEDLDNFVAGTILNEQIIAELAKESESINVYAGVVSQTIKLDKENAKYVLNYGRRLYNYGFIKINGNDLLMDDELVVHPYNPEIKNETFDPKFEKVVIDAVNNGDDVEIAIIGAALQSVLVHKEEDEDNVVTVLGNDPLIEKKALLISDMYAFFSYYLNLTEGVGEDDDIDQLGNRRVRTAGELVQNQFRIGLARMERVVKERMSISDVSNLTPKNLTNIRPLTAVVKEFFSSSQLSQFMDQTNPLAELTNKRRISALGPGGLTRERAGFEVRDVHNSHYGRICPIETPEGPNIGLINNLTTYGRINEYGFIETPYRIVKDGVVSEEVIYLDADEEEDYIIAQANAIVDNVIVGDEVVAREAGETVMAKVKDVELADISPQQIVSVATACIPFLENDDASRALMGANMQRQGVPLMKPTAPLVGTGIEHRVAKDSGSAIVAKENGIVTYVDAQKIVITGDEGEHTYRIDKFVRSNGGTCLNQHPIVDKGENISKGDIIADGASMENGELALGQNVRVAFTTWHGYNFEDAVIISERLVKDDVYTSIHIEEHEIEIRDTKLGPEEITRDIPNVSESSIRHLDGRGIVMEGAEVKDGDVLVGKVTPKGQSEVSPEEKLLLAIFGEKSREVRDNSLRVPHGGEGIVQMVRVFDRKDGHDLQPGVEQVVKVYIVQKRKISEGDKMAGRHGNKGVISKVLPEEDMPYLPDGTPIDMMLNPFGVPSRMNIGQILELHLGYAAEKIGVKFATPVFDGINNVDLKEIMTEADIPLDGKEKLYDGRTGEPFDERIAVGQMYMLKLSHMVDDKLHARSTGPYSMVTQQPLGGKAQNGGQRFGEMEVWALEAFGAANTLEELLTIKSDDVIGRKIAFKAIQKGTDLPEPGMPESFKVLINELKALAIDVKLLDASGLSTAKEVEVEPISDALESILEEELGVDSIDLEDLENIPEAAIVGIDEED